MINIEQANRDIALWVGFQETSEGYFDAEELLSDCEEDNTFEIRDLKFHKDSNWQWICLDKLMSYIACNLGGINDDFRLELEFASTKLDIFESIYDCVLTLKENEQR